MPPPADFQPEEEMTHTVMGVSGCFIRKEACALLRDFDKKALVSRRFASVPTLL